MPGKNRPRETKIVNHFLRNKYWFIGSALFFLFAASVYLIFAPPKYKVTTTILVNYKFPENVIKNITSKFIVQKTISELPLKVSYYRNKIEMPEDSLPVKFIPVKNALPNSSKKFVVTILDNQQYEIEENDTLTDFFFNRPANYSSAKFVGIKGPAFSLNAKAVTVRIKPQAQLFQEYYDNLTAKFTDDDHKAITLNLTTSSVKNGKIFLNGLVEQYTKYYKIANQSNELAAAGRDQDIQRVSRELAILKLKAKQLEDQQAEYLSLKEKENKEKTYDSEKIAELNTLNAIQPYAKSAVNQFALIPDSYQVKDSQLKMLITQMNKMESDKQEALQNSQTTIGTIIGFNKRLSLIKQTIIQRISIDKDELNKSKPSAEKNIAAVSPIVSLSKINSQLKSKLLEYNSLLKNQPENKKTEAQHSSQVIVEKGDERVGIYPRPGFIYFLALLIGLALPLIAQYFKLPLNQILSAKKLGKKNNNLIPTDNNASQTWKLTRWSRHAQFVLQILLIKWRLK